MNVTEMLDYLDREANRIAKLRTFVIANKERLDQLGVSFTYYFGGIDFDQLSHKDVVRVVQTFPGKWNKAESSGGGGGRIDYVTEVDGIRLRLWAGEPPPSCQIVEEVVEVPATTKIIRKLVCSEPTTRIEAVREGVL